MPRKSLFDDDEQEDPKAELRVNEEYARRFEHNKKREELHRLQEKYPEQAAKLAKERAFSAVAVAKAKAKAALAADAAKDDEEEPSEGEEDDDGEIDEKTQAQIFETLMKIRSRDQSIYDKEAKFYSSESEEEEAGPAAAQPKENRERPMYLKDVIYKQAMEGGDSSDDDATAGGEQQPPRTYTQEQRQLKQAFLQAFEQEVEGDGGEAGDGFGAGVLQERKRQQQRAAAQGDGSYDSEGEGAEGGDAAADARVQQLLDSYFGRDEQLSADDRFLKRYILNKGWVEEGDAGFEDADEEQVDDQEDEEFLEEAEQFEHAYNFRFEEPGGAAIVTHPRNIEGTVRKTDDRRKKARAEKAARQAEEEEQRRAEIRRLKNLKKAEIQEKLQEIQGVAGRAAPQEEALDALMEGDFDPEEYDKRMAAAFGDDYYAADADEEGEDDLADEAFERELEAMARYGSDDEDPQSFAALHKRMAAQRREDAAAAKRGEGEEAEEEAEQEGDGQAGAAADPEAAAATRAEMQRLLEEYYRLDYEDVVGGIPTRFRYKEVAPDSFGLSVEEILALEDRELNQVVGLKKLAPYRDEHRKFRPNYQKLNELRRQQGEEQAQHHGGKSGWGSKPLAGAKSQQQQERPGKPWRQKGGGQQRGGQQRHQQGEQPPRKEKSAEERRLESFAKPTLKRAKQQEGDHQQEGPTQGSKRKREQHEGSGGSGQPKQPKQPHQQQQQPVNDDGPKLTKTQKKNLKRAEKRAAKRTKTDA